MFILDILYAAIAVILLFGATIVVHEFGHFLAAYWLGMVINVFSIGVGPAIWKRKIKGVLYKIGLVPFAGYVVLPQMEPQGVAEAAKSDDSLESESANKVKSRQGALPPVAAWKKIIVAISGALGNIALAILLAWIVYWVGKPSTPAEHSSVIGFVATNSIAYEKGLRAGNEIIAVNSRHVDNWNEILQENARHDEVILTIKQDGNLHTISVPTAKNVFGIRVVEGLTEVSLCRVRAVEAGSTAHQAGIQNGDIIKAFDEIPIVSIEQLINLVRYRENIKVPIDVERNSELLSLLVTPQLDPKLKRARIGIQFDPMAIDYDYVVHIPPSVQLRKHATAILRAVRSLMTPKEARSTAQGIGGPLMILYMTLIMVRRGLIIALWFTCFLNVNLAILNLLPIPILDGGHVVFSLWELITRHPAHPKFVLWISQIFAALLIILFVMLTGRDILRLFFIQRLNEHVTGEEKTTNSVSSDTLDMEKHE